MSPVEIKVTVLSGLDVANVCEPNGEFKAFPDLQPDKKRQRKITRKMSLRGI